MIEPAPRTSPGPTAGYPSLQEEGEAMPKPVQYDNIGLWSEIKLAILKEYTKAYSTILARQPRLYHIYIDAFAGPGEHLSRRTGELVPGSPLNALAVKPGFREYHLIDLDRQKVAHLRALVGDRPDVEFYEEDCNKVLIEKVLPRARYEDYRRALCLLDPYGLSLSWDVVVMAGQMRSVDLFLNFPIEGINRNVLRSDTRRVGKLGSERMTTFWGDESWRKVAYAADQNLFGDIDVVKRPGNEPIVKAYQDRLRSVGGFKFVPDPMPMRNSKGAVVYYLFFASHNEAGDRIARHIFKKYRGRGAA
jgi:three-Cys-motif partner protein